MANILILVASIIIAVVPYFHCEEYSYSMYTGASIEVCNKEYPGEYRSGTTQDWIITCTNNTYFRLDSVDIKINSRDRLCLAVPGHEYYNTLNCNQEDHFDINTWQHNTLIISLPKTTKPGSFRIFLYCLRQDNSTTSPSLPTTHNPPTTKTPPTSPTTKTPPTSPTTKTPLPTPTTKSPPGNNAQCECDANKAFLKGNLAGPNEFPFMGALFYEYSKGLIGAAVLISDRFALTTAHLQEYFEGSATKLILGQHDLTDLHDRVQYFRYFMYPIQKMYTHHHYDGNDDTVDNIAVIQTLHTIVFTDAIRPICLPYNFNLNPRDDVRALGWGSRMVRPTILNKVDLMYPGEGSCADLLNTTTILPTQMCVYEEGREVCSYDSGGPIMYYDGNKRSYILVGLVSRYDCHHENYTSLNTRIGPYLDFIEGITQRNLGFCQV